jgi:hypothetical protein
VTTGAKTGPVFWTETTTDAVIVMDVRSGGGPPFQVLKPGRLPKSGLPRWYVRGSRR